jgi:hypothetical protein
MHLLLIKLQLGSGPRKNNNSINLFEENILTVLLISKRKINKKVLSKIIPKKGKKHKKKLC